MDDLRLQAVAARVVAWHNRQPLARRIAEAYPRPLHRDRNPRRVHQVGEALGGPHHDRRNRVWTDTSENSLAGRPRALDGVRLHPRNKIDVDALGGAAQCELA